MWAFSSLAPKQQQQQQQQHQHQHQQNTNYIFYDPVRLHNLSAVIHFLSSGPKERDDGLSERQESQPNKLIKMWCVSKWGGDRPV